MTVEQSSEFRPERKAEVMSGRLRLTPVRRAAAGTLAVGFAAQGIVAVSGILAARLLGPEDRGHLALYTLVSALLVELGGLGLPTAVTYEVARAPRLAGRIARRVTLPALTQAAVLLLVQIALLAAITNDGHSVVVAAGISLGLVPAVLAQRYSLALLQGQQRFGWFNALRVAPPTFYTLSIVGIALAGQGSLIGVTVGLVAGNALAGACGLVVARRTMPPDPDGATAPSLRTMVRFGMKAMLGSASPVETFSVDQAVVGLVLSPATLGLYVAAVAVTNLPGFVAKSVGLIAYPRVASHASPEEARAAVWRFFAFNIAIAIALVIPLEVLCGTLVPLLFGEDFRDAVPITRILLISAVFFAARRVLSDGARGAGHPGLGSVAEMLSWTVLFPLLPVMAAWRGAEGVAVALVIASGAALLILVVLVRRRLGSEPA